MVVEICSWVRCQVEVVAWIDGGAWCGGHAILLLAGHRPLPEEGMGADQGKAARARRLSEYGASLPRLAVSTK
jgi:hypothetical protein